MQPVASQLAMPGRNLPVGDHWVFEKKYDGYRCQIIVQSGSVRLFTRNGLDWSERFAPSLSMDGMPTTDCTIDGEIVALDDNGRPDFSRLCHGLSRGNIRLSYFAFDLLSHMGDSLTEQPLHVRKERLASVVAGADAVHFVEHTKDGPGLFSALRSAGWEGIMAKDSSAPYRPGMRTPAWVKLKYAQRQEFVIAGWRADSTSGDLKSVALATLENGRMVLRGSVGSGFSSVERQEFPKLLARHSKCSKDQVKDRNGIRWLTPNIVAEIEFAGLTATGCVRGASFIGIREDKVASDIQLEPVR